MTTRLSRRTVLRGLSCAMGLPLLDAMLPRSLRAAEAAANKSKPPVRMAFISFPNGAIMPAWRPEGEGTSFELKETLAPLSNLKSHVTIITGLAQDNGRAKGDGPGDHATLIAAARAEPRIAELLSGKEVVKMIVVPGKLVNFVVK